MNKDTHNLRIAITDMTVLEQEMSGIEWCEQIQMFDFAIYGLVWANLCRKWMEIYMNFMEGNMNYLLLVNESNVDYDMWEYYGAALLSF